jgi:hypothetical protein
MARFRKTVILLIFSLGVGVLTCLLCEGFSSTFFVAREAITGRPLAERSHTEYDEELGWINIPNVNIENLYGPGIYAETNSQSFRNNYDFSIDVPSNKVRIICSGDSFTFGYGVDNDHTWCQLLVSIDERLETVNMGQGGYGVDQAYLWYKRDGTKLEHDVLIFTFITDDFERMKGDTFLGYGKPVLELQDGTTVTKNVPVPRRSFYTPWLIHALRTLNGLKSLRFSQELFYRGSPVAAITDEKSQGIVAAILDDLKRTNQAKNSVLVLAYLPTQDDYTKNSSEPWRQFLHARASENDLLFIDVIEEFRKLPPQEVYKLFIGEGVVDHYGAAGHYTEDGNAFIANTLYEKLLAVPEISEKLQK